MKYKKKQRNVIQLTDNQELFVIGDKRNGITIKNQDGKLITTELKICEIPDIYIYNANLAEIINYIFSYLLEEYNKLPSNNKHISYILNNHYNIFLGKENKNRDVNKIEFQIVSYLKKE